MKVGKFLLITPLLFLLYACPVGLDYSMSDQHESDVDNKLIGVWESDRPDGEIQKLEISKLSKTSLKVTVITPGESYSLESFELTAWLTHMEGKDFMVLKPDDEQRFFHYCYWFDGEEIVFCDVSLLSGGVDGVTSNQELREEVAASMKMEGWGYEHTRLHKL